MTPLILGKLHLGFSVSGACSPQYTAQGRPATMLSGPFRSHKVLTTRFEPQKLWSLAPLTLEVPKSPPKSPRTRIIGF